MCLVKDFVARHQDAEPLRGINTLFIQHQLGNQVPMAEALIALGLDPQRIFWLDIPYTASSRVQYELCERLGIPAGQLWVNRYRVLEAYRPYQRRRVQELVREMLRLDLDRVVVLDDGAYFVEAAAGFKKRLDRVSVVEQTTRGFIKIAQSADLRQYAQSIPIVNVAGSIPKLDLEPPWIGQAVKTSLLHALSTLADERPEFTLDADTSCLVLGYGIIGRQVAHMLRHRFRVTVFDTDEAATKRARDDCFAHWDRTNFSTRFRLVVGCSGRQSFGVGDYVYLDDYAVLVSASSGSVELSRQEFIDLAVSSQIDDIRVDVRGLHEEQIHRPLFIDVVDRRVVFLNRGFPINFDGRVNCVPTRYMQPTALLMIQGALQAAAGNVPGCVQLDAEFCEWLDESFRQFLTPKEAQMLPTLSTRHPRNCWND